jgi:hypothetical protein
MRGIVLVGRHEGGMGRCGLSCRQAPKSVKPLWRKARDASVMTHNRLAGTGQCSSAKDSGGVSSFAVACASIAIKKLFGMQGG